MQEQTEGEQHQKEEEDQDLATGGDQSPGLREGDAVVAWLVSARITVEANRLHAPERQQGQAPDHHGDHDHEAQKHRLQQSRIGDAIEGAQAETDGDRSDDDSHGEHAPDDAHRPGSLLLLGAVDHQSQIGGGGQRHTQAVQRIQTAEASDAEGQLRLTAGREKPSQTKGERHREHRQEAEGGGPEQDVRHPPPPPERVRIGDLPEQHP